MKFWEKNIVKKNNTADDIYRMLKNVAESWSRNDHDGVICFFSSHGTEGHIFGSDGKLLAVRDICAVLNSINDPKIIIFSGK